MAFTLGKAKSVLLGIQGLIGHRKAPDWDFLYTASSTKSPKWEIGDRVALPDGRAFRYAKCGYLNINQNKYGVKAGSVLVACKVANGSTNEVTVPSVAVGKKEVTVAFTAGTLGDSTSNGHAERTGVVAENELRGGYISFYTGNYRQQRGIIGNTAVAIGDTSMTIYLDAALDHILTSGESYCEILANPYGNVYRDNSQWCSVIGMPNVRATDGQYLWLQTWGPLRISGTSNSVGSSREREFVFDDQGAVVPIHGNMGSRDEQHAGFLIERTQSDTDYQGAPFIMLQICP